MEQFLKEKNLPVRTFLGDETKNAIGLNGPGAIAEDIDSILKMFDPESERTIVNEAGESETVPGGISEENLRPDLREYFQVTEALQKEKFRFFVYLAENNEEYQCSCNYEDIVSAYYTNKLLMLSVIMDDGDSPFRHNFTQHSLNDDGSINEALYLAFSGIIANVAYELIFWNPQIKTDGPIIEFKKPGWLKDFLTSDSLPEWVRSDTKPTYTADEVGTYSKDEIGEIHSQFIHKATYEADMLKKADKATTLAGYGITDSYTKDEVDESLSKKTEETVLYEDVVNTPVWTNQPTYDGTLDSSLNTEDFYYVTLKDASGNELPSDQFMLKSSYDDTATVYTSVFTLANLNTGADTLIENFPIEFIKIGEIVKMRDAGVSAIIQDIAVWNISNGTGSIRIVAQGEVIPRVDNLYCYTHFKTDKNVATYHSSNGSIAFSSDSTKDIVPYTTIPELVNTGNMLFDDAVLKKDGNGYFSVERKFVVRYNENYKNAKSYQVFGFGKAISDDTNITSVALRFNNVKNGVFRNGTKIIVSEVK